MILTGQVVKTDSGKRLQVKAPINTGAQGAAYWATDLNNREPGVLKVFFDSPNNDDLIRRLQFLVRLDLGKACPVIRAPTDLITRSGLVGHYAPAAQGQPLEAFLANPNASFVANLQAALALVHALTVLDERQLTHGDLHADNLAVNDRKGVLEVSLFDLDNFRAPGLPPPPCIGHNLYLAPELRRPLSLGRPVLPDQASDRFALGVLLHEIILLRHPAAGFDATEEEFTAAMLAGRWLHDPAAPARPSKPLGGYPAEVLNVDLCRLFRKASSELREDRPSPREWEQTLARAIYDVYLCPTCGNPCLIDASKTTCPHCGTNFPALKLLLAGGETIPLAHGAVPVGRDRLGGSLRVSIHHAVFRRVGPETQCESFGDNGTYRRTASGWRQLPPGKPVLVENGDQLRFGDVEAAVVWA